MQFDRYVIPANSDVRVNFPPVNRNYCKNGNEFLPDRWLDEAENNKENDQIEFFSFSEGPRSCIGQRFFFLEVTIILTKLLLRFDVHRLNKDIDVSIVFVYEPADGGLISITKRTKESEHYSDY